MTQNVVNLIRLADNEDLDNIVSLHNLVLVEYYNELTTLGITRQSNSHYWDNRLSPNLFATTFVAYSIEGILVGFGNTSSDISQENLIENFDGFIENLYVSELTNNMNLLKRILALLASQFLCEQKKTAYTWILSSNRRMRYFCQLTGATEIGKKKVNHKGILINYTAYGWKNLIPLLQYI